ncbi:carbohydrate ABC transporter substrate-binding protein, CUT1 family [Actinacidiphila yanglinensis]|uniref:Carbohydrate ABC transporter substrate-binding protein, CUT1 family n=1 Tax=Actinacidiphila yanglinensis TaxID=310779 RepID=A0A1H6CSX5_9ACTN|nr:extracellular solute-binding protein [Actinacidiphila yanglinensis]SEG75685.1 carbohydrate ABC transporter substrate-binding protein, CUT1 family [Actinacidiphila yanglinensis]
MTNKVLRRWAPGIALVATAALALTACGSGGSGSGKDSGAGGAAAVKSALAKGGTITVWAWEPTLKQVVTDFQQKYPKVHVKLVNAGTGKDQYTALQNAVQAGKGVPDVAQIEYFALSQFALGKSVTDLSAYGAKSLSKTYSPGPWNSVNIDGGIYGLPMDSGPMALFYNKKVFDTYKLPVPTTWDQYLDDARKLHQADPKAYITSDTGDAGMTTSLIWQAGGKPYQVDGTKVSVDFAHDSGTATYTKVWQQLISGHLLSPVIPWSDQWYKGLGDGTIATLATGAWMPANFSSGVKAAAGDWRVAPLPQWQAGASASAENGGSSLAVMKASSNKELAYAFLQYANQGAGVQARIKGGAFPATTADLDSQAFLNTSFPYFGGQQANKIFSQSAKNVLPGWSYLPYQVYANSIFNDTVGKAYVSGTPLSDGLSTWQDKSVSYGKQQGFSVG